MKRGKALARKTPLVRKTAVKRRRDTPRRSGRERSHAYLAAVHEVSCWMRQTHPRHRCRGPIEADHAGERPVGRKSHDRETIALCRLAHRQRTGTSGPFRCATKESMRSWLDRGVVWTRAQIRRKGEEILMARIKAVSVYRFVSRAFLGDKVRGKDENGRTWEFVITSEASIAAYAKDLERAAVYWAVDHEMHRDTGVTLHDVHTDPDYTKCHCAARAEEAAAMQRSSERPCLIRVWAVGEPPGVAAVGGPP